MNARRRYSRRRLFNHGSPAPVRWTDPCGEYEGPGNHFPGPSAFIFMGTLHRGYHDSFGFGSGASISEGTSTPRSTSSSFDFTWSAPSFTSIS